MKTFLLHSRPLLLYAALLALLVFVLKWLQWKFLIADNALDIYIGLIALFFTALGVWVASQLLKPKVKTVVVEKQVEVYVEREAVAGTGLELVAGINTEELEKLNLSKREYEVLQLLAKGHSNAEIADTLCLSLSTVKTHVSNLFVKMEVNSRVKAMEKARLLRLTN